MDDVIYRQDTVNELREYITEPSISDDESEIIGYNDGIELAISVLSTMPSARRKGHWKGERLKYPSGIINFIYHCSECGYEERHAYEDSKPSNFCPNCGAYMRGENNG